MPETTQIILVVGFICLIFAVLLIHLGKHEDVNIRLIFRVKFSHKELEKHIKQQFIRPIMIFSFIGIYSIWIATISMLIVN